MSEAQPDSNGRLPSLRAASDRYRDWFRTVDLRILLAILYWSVLGVAMSYGFILLLFVGSSLARLLATLPMLIQVACVSLVVATAIFLCSMLRERARVFQACDQFLAVLASTSRLSTEERSHGLPAERVVAMRSKAEALKGHPAEWWRRLDETITEFTDSSGRQGWFVTRPVSESLPESEVVDPIYHASFHHGVPGVLTAMGLLATFAAILVALAGVKYDAGNALHPVSGIDQLINGLSGKFLSSVIALILGIVFGLVERKFCERQVYRRYNNLVRRCQEALPFLSQTRILLEMHRVALNTTQGSLGVTLEPRHWRV